MATTQGGTKPAGMREDSVYAAHPALAMESAVARNLEKNTGKPLEAWVRIAREEGPPTLKERAAWLQREHGLGMVMAQVVAEHAEGVALHYDPDGYVEKMFAGKKAGLRPIYDALLELAFELGPDVTVTPCATIVPIRRRYVIAQIKPAALTRIDLGFALKDTPASGRLIDTGGRAKGDRITPRIAITSLDDIDDEVKGWLRRAYEMDGSPKS